VHFSDTILFSFYAKFMTSNFVVLIVVLMSTL
jgi:hypothetical protein